VPRTSTTATLISLVPFTLALLVFARDVDRGTAGEPEEVVLKDPLLLILGALWAASLAATLYLDV
jgi:decaprenyl-phosphate phosphoribosyltransferase